MNNSGPGNGFLTGYSGGFLGMSKNLPKSGGFLGLNRQQTESSMPAPQPNEEGQSSMNMRTRLENFRPILPKGLLLSTERERTTGPSNVVDNSSNSIASDDDDDDSSDENGDNGGDGKGGKGSNWQRMKWTDDVIMLLIEVVASVGDDGSLKGPDGLKRKSEHLHKKGKWKTVSKIMINKGCHVSPQQCEDKFNDLNKRFKKLNDILGRGSSCKVVENPALMEFMPHLSAKAKETVKKLLCSKHLFYKEICAYHNGQTIPDCGNLELQVHPAPVDTHSRMESNALTVGAECFQDNNSSPVGVRSWRKNNASSHGDGCAGNNNSSRIATQCWRENIAASVETGCSQDNNSSPIEMRCLRVNKSPSAGANCSKDINGSPVVAQCSMDNNCSQDVEAEVNDVTDEDDSESESDDRTSGNMYCDIVDSDDTAGSRRLQPGRNDHFQTEIDDIFKDPTKSHCDRRQWVKKRMYQLQEERVAIQWEALQLEKQRIKWQRFCSKKEEELEMARLAKDRLILGNKSKALQLKQKEVDIEFQSPEVSL